jgi:hypothetical protein
MRHVTVVLATRGHLHPAHKKLYLQSNLLVGSGCLDRLLRTQILGVPLLSPFLAAECVLSCTIIFLVCAQFA